MILDDPVNQELASVSERVLPKGMRLAYVQLDSLQEQAVNARSMPKAMFDQLTENIRKSGAPEALPLCVLQGERVAIISGHHRIRAARAAGLKSILVILYMELPESSVKAKQLAHNSIAGSDDAELIKKIWEGIADVQAKFEAFIDPRIFNGIPDPVKFKPIDADLANMVKTCVIVFLPTQKMDYDACVEKILPNIEIDQIYLASRESFDAWKDAMAKVRSECNIIAVPVAVAQMARLASEMIEIKAKDKKEE